MKRKTLCKWKCHSTQQERRHAEEKRKGKRNKHQREKAFGVRCEALEKVGMECHGRSQYRKFPPSLRVSVQMSRFTTETSEIHL